MTFIRGNISDTINTIYERGQFRTDFPLMRLVQASERYANGQGTPHYPVPATFGEVTIHSQGVSIELVPPRRYEAYRFWC